MTVMKNKHRTAKFSVRDISWLSTEAEKVDVELVLCFFYNKFKNVIKTLKITKKKCKNLQNFFLNF